MVFQDFDQITERRRLERQRQFRKKLIIASIVAIICISLIVACAYAFVGQEMKNNKNKDVDDHKKARSDGDEDNTPKKSTKPAPNDHDDDGKGGDDTKKGSGDDKKETTKDISNVQKMVKTVCNSTTYQTRCQTTYDDAIKKNSSITANDLIKVSIQAINTEIQDVMSKINNLKFDDPRAKEAFEDCKKLIVDAKDELNDSISTAGEDLKEMAKNVPDLRNWLSAIMSYQQTCIDGFPDGKTKTEMDKSFNASKEFTSNSLAVVATSDSLFSALNIVLPSGASRRLLNNEQEDGYPDWLTHEDRRMLKGAVIDKPKANKVVAKDGSGDFKTIGEAIKAIPEKYDGRYIIYVKQGVYEESVTIEKRMENVTIYGDGSQKSIITGSKNFADGLSTLDTATFVVLGNGFVGQTMGFRNTAGASKDQAVALRVQGDKAVFINSRFEGYQDTLYAQNHRQYYKGCVISGTVDFIFGDAAAVFQNCLILLRKPLDNQQNTITAHGRMDKYQSTGFVIQNCRIEADKDLDGPAKDKVKSYLGRPWRDYSRTVVMESTLDLIQPEGWLAWEGEKGLNTLYYAEYANKGPDANTDKRVKWAGFHVINREEAMKFTVVPFLQGDEWIDEAGAQIKAGLFS